MPCRCAMRVSQASGTRRKPKVFRPFPAWRDARLANKIAGKKQNPEETRMLQRFNIRHLVICAVALCALALAIPSARAADPIRIGFGMALTGPLAPNGKSALLAMKIWEEDINAKGGLIGRPVKLVYYDDKSSPS